MESGSEKRETGKFYSIVRGYFNKVEMWLEGREMEEKKPRFCFEIRDDATALIKILNEKNISFELNPFDEQLGSSLLKIFD